MPHDERADATPSCPLPKHAQSTPAQPHTHRPPKHSPAFYLRLWRAARRFAVLVTGTTVILIGVVLLVTPGPAFVVIPIGLAILASEFPWARRLLRRLREQASRAARRVAHRLSRSRPPS